MLNAEHLHSIPVMRIFGFWHKCCSRKEELLKFRLPRNDSLQRLGVIADTHN
ncbi:hypothetical protein P245_15375 [Comamonas thiooxydans]|uniref:Uncharacterized protein n=1 Tax=Comamonas thiooxydans TaxID=363952 RepID=A0A0E3C191_9BURK|nr:hypothetical protein P245_15375 [Comamonas thiooxydans]